MIPIKQPLPEQKSQLRDHRDVDLCQSENKFLLLAIKLSQALLVLLIIYHEVSKVQNNIVNRQNIPVISPSTIGPSRPCKILNALALSLGLTQS